MRSVKLDVSSSSLICSTSPVSPKSQTADSYNLPLSVVANFAEELADEATGEALAKYLLIFTPAWHIWSDLREMMNSYYTDDIIQRLIILWVMALLILYANNAPHIEELTALRTTVGSYVVARFTTASALTIASFASYQHRTQARSLAIFMFIGLLLTIPLFLEGISLRAKAFNVLAIIVWQELTWGITLSPWIKRKLNLTYSTAVDIAHEIDRMAAFFIIILGEFVYSVVVGNPAGIGLTHGYGKAACTLIIAFSLNWMYVSGDGSLQATHPIRRSAWTAFAFFLLHLPMSASFLIGGHLCAVSVGTDQFENGQRWLLGGGLGVGICCLWVYGMLYRSEDEDRMLLPRFLRIGMRLVIGVVLIVLPETHEYLSTTQFMAVVAALFALTLVWETVGGLTKDFHFVEPWDGRHPPKDDARTNSEGAMHE